MDRPPVKERRGVSRGAIGLLCGPVPGGQCGHKWGDGPVRPQGSEQWSGKTLLASLRGPAVRDLTDLGLPKSRPLSGPPAMVRIRPVATLVD